MNAAEQYVRLYDDCRDLIDQGSPDSLNTARRQAMEALRQSGLPSRKDEQWRYTDVQAAFAPDYGLNFRRFDPPADARDVFNCDVPNLSTQTVFLVNDIPHPSASLLPVWGREDTKGVFIGSFRQAAQVCPHLLQDAYARIADAPTPVCWLNTAFAQDGLLVHVPRGQRLTAPLQVINLLRSQSPLMVNRRVLILLEEQAEATVLFCDHAMDPVPFLATQVMEVRMGNGARLDLYELEETHTRASRFADLYIRADSHCHLAHHTVTLFNGLSRNTLSLQLLGPHTDALLTGLVITDQQQHVDNNTLIDHRAPDCRSRQLYKYIADEQSTAAFAGKILVRPEAQRTNAQETNANLCAASTAHIYAQPTLEIYADDVQCSHGSSTGVLDAAALFYMQQRGIPADEARTLLKVAFAAQVLARMPLTPMRDRLQYLVEKRFRGQLYKCALCAQCQ